MTQALSESESKKMLASYGVPISREVVVATADQVADAATELGFPVVVKLCGDTILHKTELDAVRLNLGSPDAAQAAAQELLDNGPDGAEVLVAEQVQGNRELILGVTQDAQFGTTLMFGVGGIFAEVLGDVVFRLLPATDDELRSMLDDLDNPTFLDSFRGEPAVDRDALVAALSGVARCVAEHPEIDAIDVNPMIVRDGLPIAVDGLIVLNATATSKETS